MPNEIDYFEAIVTAPLVVMPSGVENRAAREAARWTGRPKAERGERKRITSLDPLRHPSNNTENDLFIARRSRRSRSIGERSLQAEGGLAPSRRTGVDCWRRPALRPLAELKSEERRPQSDAPHLRCAVGDKGVATLTIRPDRLCAAGLPREQRHKPRPCRRELARLSSVLPVPFHWYRDRA